MADPPVDRSGVLLHFTEGTRHGVHVSPAGRHRLVEGDVVLLRPGVWHGYDQCAGLDLFNCCFSAELLQRELAWTRCTTIYCGRARTRCPGAVCWPPVCRRGPAPSVPSTWTRWTACVRVP
jgi:hypothetical protein